MSDQESLDVSIPNEAGWPTKTLDELCSLISRGTAPVYVESSSVLAIGQRCVTTSRFAPEFARPHSERAMRNVLRPESGDVLLNSTGTGTIGRSVVFGHDGSFIVDGHVTVLRPKPESADGRWLNTVLRTSWGQRHLERFCYAGSTNQLELSRTPVKASMLPVPSLAEQHAIAQILDTLDTAIRETEALIDKLKAVKQGLLHDLLTRGIDTNGQLRPPQSEAPQLYKESPLGWIPREWEVGIFGDMIGHIIDFRGRTPKKLGMDWGGGNILALSANNVQPGGIDVSKEAYFGSERLYQKWMTSGDTQKGDVLLTMEAPLGNVAQIPDEEKYILSQRVIAMRFKSTVILNDFAFWQMQSQLFQQAMVRRSTGSTATGIKRAELVKLYFRAPPVSEQSLIAARLFSIDQVLSDESASLGKQKKEKVGLMDDLLTGRVRVTPLLDSMQQLAAQTGA